MRQRVGLFGQIPAVRSLVLVAVVALGAALTSGCVPYQQYKRAEDNLRTTLLVTDDLEKQLKEAELRLARHGGQEGIAHANFNELKLRYEELLEENATLKSANAALIEQINNLPAFDPGDGFSRQDAETAGGTLGADGQIVMDGNVLFAPGKTQLRDEAKRNLDRLAALIRDRHPDRVLYIHGHTDVSKIKSSRKLHKDNWELGLKRAHSVFAYLSGKGLAKEQMRLASAGYAEPAAGVADPSSKEGMARCRRVEVYLGNSQ
ncbi:MAG: OmpA family protein [Planctomycetota bacterium]